MMITRNLLHLVFLLSLALNAQRATLDSLIRVDDRLDGDQKAYNQIRISKHSIDQDTALMFAKSALWLSQSDTTRILAQNQMAWLLKNDGQIDSAKSLLKTAIQQAERLNFKVGLSDLFLTYGSIYNRTSAYDSALYYQQKAFKIFQLLDDLDGQASILNNMSILYQKTGEYDKSKKVLMKSMKIRNQQKKLKETGDIYLNLGNVYYYKGLLDSCIFSFVKALEIYEQERLPNFQSYALANLAYIYSQELGDIKKAKTYFLKIIKIENELKSQNTVANAYDGLGTIYKDEAKYDSAIYYYQACLNIAEKTQNTQMASIAYTNLGIVYEVLGQYQKSKELLTKSVAIKKEINDKTGLIAALNGLAAAEKSLHNYEKANSFLSEAYGLAVEIDNKVEIRNILASQIQLKKETGHLDGIVNLYDEFISIKDAILNIEKVSAIEELKTQYETEKKEQQIALQEAQLSEKEAQIERNRLMIVSLTTVVLLIAGLWLLNRSRLKKKQLLALQEERLAAREAQINATISSQEKERARYARDLHDGFGQMISILNINLGSLRKDAKPDERQKVFEESEKVINEMYNELKGICFDLMPQTLVKNGIAAALEEFSTRINAAGKVLVETNFFGLEHRLPEVYEISLYRISQEWVNNILKYSDAQRITVQLTKDSQEINLLIEDDGSGFDKDLLLQGKGNGWKNIQTRANLIHGEVDLDTLKDRKGNTLIINANLKSYVEIAKENTVQVV